MDIISDISAYAGTLSGVVLTIGSFDGIHLGHRKVIDTVLAKADEVGGVSALLTMSPHPREFFSPDHAPNLLTSEAMKADLIATAGIDYLFILPFNATTANLSAQEFLEEIILERCHARHLVVGHDFRFGAKASGDYSFLVQRAEAFGFTVDQVPPLVITGERVSSTLIRERILQGDLESAKRYLGRPYSIMGEVCAGRGYGAKLGFPTANIRPLHSAVPAQGVYIAETRMDGGRCVPTAVNIGIAPTLRHDDLTIEAHLIDFDEDLRGKTIEVIFHQRLRPERKFPSLEALTEQIASDVDEARRYFG